MRYPWKQSGGADRTPAGVGPRLSTAANKAAVPFRPFNLDPDFSPRRSREPAAQDPLATVPAGPSTGQIPAGTTSQQDVQLKRTIDRLTHLLHRAESALSAHPAPVSAEAERTARRRPTPRPAAERDTILHEILQANLSLRQTPRPPARNKAA